ncbi:DUF4229 domain-containing protein [Streptomyces sp. I05A-00742]|uniref:DUF4229 domain-containing protein n=1 Tax=Streptomyces sp. I05A-00742 TaxID=2732853 RepID=UPI00289AB10B|nr:DUF4229 domain-containing protein [Streptomyces sp. I05A-00742]
MSSQQPSGQKAESGQKAGSDQTAVSGQTAVSDQKAVSGQKFASLRYTALRFGLLIACFAVVWVLCYARVVPLGANNSNFVWMILLALILSAPLSWVLLRKQRDAMAVQVSERVERTRERLQANAGQEDRV